MNKKTCVMDFDGVLAEYHGFGDGQIGKPLELGIKLAERLHDEGFEIVVQSCRISYWADDGMKMGRINSIQRWLVAYLPIAELYLGEGKAFGHVYIDDRGVHVNTNWEGRHDNQTEFITAMVVAEACKD